MSAPSGAPDERARTLLATAHAHELVAALARGELSASSLCEAAIARIEALDGALNAVVVRDFERARSAAREADRALQAGERRPLLGLPMTVKEAFDVEGLPTTWGDPEARMHRAREDAVCVARLKRAGAVILGKTNVSVGLMDWQSVNPVYGRTSHPHDHALTPGGSSGGSAAAVAAGLSPLELGSDIGGSIRVPASFCGIYGHKPSYGLLPARGHAPAHHDGIEPELGVVGPFARCAEDLRLAVSVLAGPDVDEAVAYRLALPPPRIERPESARLLLLREHPSAATDPTIVGELERLAVRLRRSGARVDDGSPLLPDLHAANRTYLKLLLSINTRGKGPSDRVLSVHAWFDLLDQRARLRRQWRALFAEYDGVIAPAFGTYAFAHVDETDWSRRTLQIDGRATPYGAQLAWPGVATLPGLPATAVPVGRTVQGLPIGVQVIGPYLEDLTTIALAEQIGRLTD